MESLLEFVEGPLFRLTFAIMVLGLLRLMFLTIYNGLEAKSKAKDKDIPTPYVQKLTFGYLFPIRALRVKPVYSIISIIFHIGLIITPILLYDHILLVENSISVSWFGIALPKNWADILTLATIATALLLLIMRLGSSSARAVSSAKDYFFLILLIIPFITGYVCSNSAVGPASYDAFMLVHMLGAELIFLLLPFTKLAHAVLMPFGQWITARAWKFSPEAGEEIRVTLGKEGEKV